MLATFVIGLREGLEAALIVGIIAAFLRRNGRSLTPMIIGVAAAVLLSLGVGIGLKLVERSLPQAAQEGMETIIGIVAIVFVTGMVLWMSTHSRGLKRELEREASEALGDGSTRALTVMAFLAVLKEGFETAVFLLATFSASTNAASAVTGAVLGILVAVGLGIGLYRGGLRLNLGRFFSITGVFLLLVAAGLVVTALGTAHEAGWLDAGQHAIADLSWLAPTGSVQGALLTGVLGVPPYPTLIQAIGWFCYLVPMALYMYWPRKHRPTAATGVWIRAGVAGGLVIVAGVLALSVRPASMPQLGAAALVDASGQKAGTAQLSGNELTVTVGAMPETRMLTGTRVDPHAGVPNAIMSTGTLQESSDSLPATLTLDQLVQLNGGRLPVGFSSQQSPGPFKAAWARTGEWQAWLVGDQLLDFTQSDVTTVTLTAGGLTTSRTLTVDGQVPGAGAVSSAQVSVDPARVSAAAAAASSTRMSEVERRFWGRTLPLALIVGAVVVAAFAWRARRRTGGPTAGPTIEHPTSRTDASPLSTTALSSTTA